MGALVWHLAFILDCVDGSLARKLQKTSDFGAKLDRSLDKIKKILAIIAIIYATRFQYNLYLMLLLIGIHYLLHAVKFPENATLLAFLHQKGIKALFDPLDEQFFLIFLGPLTGHVFVFAVITVALQILNKIVHLCGSRFGANPKQGIQA